MTLRVRDEGKKLFGNHKISRGEWQQQQQQAQAEQLFNLCMFPSLSLRLLFPTNPIFYLHRFACITSGGERVSRAYEVLLIVFKRQKGEENDIKNGFITTTQTTKKITTTFAFHKRNALKSRFF